MAITIDDIRAAAARVEPYIRRTPVMTCSSIDQAVGARFFFKCENFQKVGAFKARGAANAVFSLTDLEAERGVATHSSGNHAQALALAARDRGVAAHIVMPDNAPLVKVSAVKGYGGQVVFCEPTLSAREETLARVVEQTGAAFVHPYNDERVIAGQATAAMELIRETPDLDFIVAPVGGGGLLSGTALAAAHLAPAVKVIGAEPEGAPDAHRSFKSGKLEPSQNPRTIADGLLTSLGSITFPIIMERVHDILTVSEKNIVAAMKLTWERAKIVIEPSAAVPLGAAIQRPEFFKGKRVGIILSGGNVDLDKLPWI